MAISSIELLGCSFDILAFDAGIDLACEIEALPSALSCLGLLIPLLAKSGRLGEAREYCHRAIQIGQSADLLETAKTI
jgi:hypothetical protein